MYKEDLALNYLQWLICHKTKPNHLKKQRHKNLDINVDCMQFDNLLAKNNPRQIDMPLKSINQSVFVNDNIYS